MENIGQRRSDEGLILKVNIQEILQFLNKKFGTHVETPVVFKTFKTNSVLFLEINF